MRAWRWSPVLESSRAWSAAHRLWLPALACLLGAGACGSETSRDTAPLNGAARFAVRTNADATPPAVPFDTATPRIVARARDAWPHDTSAYTQGLAIIGARLLEGTGIVGRSELREVAERSGRVVRRTPLTTRAFGEGIAAVGSRLYQLTWQGGRGYVYDTTSLALIDSVSYAGEGWGLASDGTRLYLSDGSDRIRVIEPASFTVERVISVTEAGRAVWMLNELEWANGELLANVYQTALIARIDPTTGVVRGWIDVSHLLTDAEQRNVMQRGGTANGIAYDARTGRLLVTGKLWPRLFEVELPKGAAPSR